MRKFIFLSLFALVTVFNSACEGDTVILSNPTGPSGNVNNPNNPTNPNQPVVNTRIEFRVQGNASSARVRYSNAVDGLTQVVTTLPYIATVSTTESSMFLSLEATPTAFPFSVSFPFMSVQIFAGGVLFREATSSDFFLSTLFVSGTWRR